jgi:hypothetical protein
MDASNARPIENVLIELVQEWDEMDKQQRQGARGQAILHDIRLIGQTAEFFNGCAGMQKLRDTVERMVGNTNARVGFHLNLLWDRIGGWSS